MKIRPLLVQAAVFLCLVFAAAGALAEGAPGELLIAFHVYLPPPTSDYTISVYKDGLVVLDARSDERNRRFKPQVRKHKVDLAKLKELQTLIASRDFQALKPKYDAGRYDVGTYTITLPDGAGQKTIVAANMPFGEAPKPMQQARALLELLAR